MNKRLIGYCMWLIAALSLLATSCNTVSASAKPTIVIRAPASNSEFLQGDPVSISSTSTDAVAVARVELMVDGVLVRADQAPVPQQTLVMIQLWTAIPGTHTLSVRSINTNGAPSDPAAIVVRVTPNAATPAMTPTQAPPVVCQNAALVADVTVPDGIVLTPGQTINKVWRVRNTGTCAWTEDDQLVFTRGETATSTKAIALPPTPPGETVDLTVPINAPTASGKHSGEWRFKNKNGTIFGTPLTVVVNVGPSAPNNSCAFTPVIESFVAAPTTILAGQTATLKWGAVVGATRAEIDNNIGGVATPGSINVTPTTTTTFTLTAICDGKTRTAQVTINVKPAH